MARSFLEIPGEIPPAPRFASLRKRTAMEATVADSHVATLWQVQSTKALRTLALDVAAAGGNAGKARATGSRGAVENHRGIGVGRWAGLPVSTLDPANGFTVFGENESEIEQGLEASPQSPALTSTYRLDVGKRPREVNPQQTAPPPEVSAHVLTFPALIAVYRPSGTTNCPKVFHPQQAI